MRQNGLAPHTPSSTKGTGMSSGVPDESKLPKWWLVSLAVMSLVSLILMGSADDADARSKKVTPRVTIEDWGDGTVVGQIVSRDFQCGVPGRVTVYRAKGQKPDLRKDQALKSVKVTGSDGGPFWKVQGLAVGIRVYAVFLRTSRCNRAISRVIPTKVSPSTTAAPLNARTQDKNELASRSLRYLVPEGGSKAESLFKFGSLQLGYRRTYGYDNEIIRNFNPTRIVMKPGNYDPPGNVEPLLNTDIRGNCRAPGKYVTLFKREKISYSRISDNRYKRKRVLVQCRWNKGRCAGKCVSVNTQVMKYWESPSRVDGRFIILTRVVANEFVDLPQEQFGFATRFVATKRRAKLDFKPIPDQPRSVRSVRYVRNKLKLTRYP